MTPLRRWVCAAADIAKILWMPIAGAIGRAWHADNVLRVVVGDGPPPRDDVAIFCHFDRRGALRPVTRRYIEALVASGCQVIVSSNSPNLSAEAIEWLRRRVGYIVVRRNRGHDFAAWRDALRAAGIPRSCMRRLILCNDSVYGPFQSLDSILQRMDFAKADVWSLTDSWQIRYHLQSYFVAFGPRALRSETFLKFWGELPDVPSRSWVVRHCEIGLTQRLIQAGLSCRAVWPYADVVAQLRSQQSSGPAVDCNLYDEPMALAVRTARLRALSAAANRVALNPTAELWRPLLQLGFPFVKRDLLTRNRAGVPDVSACPDVIRRFSPIDADMIIDDLRLALRETAP